MGLALGVTTATSGALVHAQAAPVTLRGALSGREALQVQVEQPSYVTVFAVGRSSAGNPIQLLSPAKGELRLVKQGGRYVPRALTVEERQRFSLTDETVVVAIASADKPRLDAFVAREDEGGYLVVSDSVVADGNRLISSLVGELFAPNTAYSAVIRQDLVQYAPMTAAALPRLSREPADYCAPDGIRAGESAGNLQQANTISMNDAFRAVDFASGGNPVDANSGTAFKFVGTQLRNGYNEYMAIPVPIPQKRPAPMPADAPRPTRAPDMPVTPRTAPDAPKLPSAPNIP